MDFSRFSKRCLEPSPLHFGSLAPPPGPSRYRVRLFLGYSLGLPGKDFGRIPARDAKEVHTGHFTSIIYWVIWGREGMRGSCSVAGSFCMVVDLALDAVIRVTWERRQKHGGPHLVLRGRVPRPARTGLETNPNGPEEVRPTSLSSGEGLLA